MPLRGCISIAAVYRAEPISRGREIQRYLAWPMFVMGDFLCEVLCRDSHGSAHQGAGSETAVDQCTQRSRESDRDSGGTDVATGYGSLVNET